MIIYQEIDMAAKSQAPRKAAAALAAKRGDRKASQVKGTSRAMAASMNEQPLDELARPSGTADQIMTARTDPVSSR